jgi:hypothetical protein
MAEAFLTVEAAVQVHYSKFTSLEKGRFLQLL